MDAKLLLINGLPMVGKGYLFLLLLHWILTLVSFFMLFFGSSIRHFFALGVMESVHIIGLGLLILSFFVWFQFSKHLERCKGKPIISIVDNLWLLGSMLLVALGLFDMVLDAFVVAMVFFAWVVLMAIRHKLKRL